MDPLNRKKKMMDQTSEACGNMIIGIRQLRLSVLDLFTTLADNGPDPQKNVARSENPFSSNTASANNKLYHQKILSNLATSHQLCTSSLPPYNIKKQQEQQQHSDLIHYVNQTISTITATLRTLDQDIVILMQNSHLISPGESVHLGLDGSPDKHIPYMDLCQSYKTYSKLNDYATSCHAYLIQQSLKRVHKRFDQASSSSQNSFSGQASRDSSASSSSRADSIVATFNPYIYKICLSRNAVTNLLDTCLKYSEFMDGVYSQPFGVSTGIFQVSVNRVLKAILVMRGIVIDAVIVKAYHESFALKSASKPSNPAALTSSFDELFDQHHTSNAPSHFVDPEDDIDLWSESRYLVFRKLTHHANAAVLHFQYPTYPEIAVRSFLVSNLFRSFFKDSHF